MQCTGQHALSYALCSGGQVVSGAVHRVHQTLYRADCTLSFHCTVGRNVTELSAADCCAVQAVSSRQWPVCSVAGNAVHGQAPPSCPPPHQAFLLGHKTCRVSWQLAGRLLGELLVWRSLIVNYGPAISSTFHLETQGKIKVKIQFTLFFIHATSE